MTIEIKQLVIRAVVEQSRDRAGPAATPRSQAPGPARPGAAPLPADRMDRDTLIAECTRQVLRELRKGRER